MEQGTIKTGEDVEILGLMQVSYKVEFIYFICQCCLILANINSGTTPTWKQNNVERANTEFGILDSSTKILQLT